MKRPRVLVKSPAHGRFASSHSLTGNGPASPRAQRCAWVLPVRSVTLALQGGGALGTFTWGVLDRLLEEPRLSIGAVSGASAGAMNAAMLVQGLATGGPPEAKRLLASFWRRVADAAGSPDFGDASRVDPFEALFGVTTHAMRQVSRWTTPLTVNPLRCVLDGLLNTSAFGMAGAPTLVVAATLVRTGEARLFQDTEVTAEVLLASACLPQLFPPVEIGGERYCDGGFASNPPLRPLIEAGAPTDVILVRTTPVERPEPPEGIGDIRGRAAELAFASALRYELCSIETVQRLLAELPDAAAPGTALARLRDARLHAISAEEAFRALPFGSALDTRWGSFCQLHQLGRGAAERWLNENLSAVGVRPTLDLASLDRQLGR